MPDVLLFFPFHRPPTFLLFPKKKTPVFDLWLHGLQLSVIELFYFLFFFLFFVFCFVLQWRIDALHTPPPPSLRMA